MARGLLVLPGPDWHRDPEGCIVVDSRGSTWAVHRFPDGKREEREYESATEAFSYLHRRYLRWNERVTSSELRPTLVARGLPPDSVVLGAEPGPPGWR